MSDLQLEFSSLKARNDALKVENEVFRKDFELEQRQRLVVETRLREEIKRLREENGRLHVRHHQGEANNGTCGDVQGDLEQMRKIQTENELLKQDLYAQRQKSDELQLALRSESERCIGLRKLLEHHKKMEENIHQQIETLNNKNADLQRQFNQQYYQLQDAHNKNDQLAHSVQYMTSEKEKAEKRMENALGELQALKSQGSGHSSSEVQRANANLKADNALLEGQVTDLTRESKRLKNAHEKAVADLKAVQETLEKKERFGAFVDLQSTKLKEEINALETKLKETEEQLRDYKEYGEKVVEENECLTKIRKDNEVERNNHRKQIKSMETEKQDLVLQQKKLEEKIKELTVQNESLKKEAKNARQKSQEQQEWSRETEERRKRGWSDDSALGQDGSLGSNRGRSHEITSYEGTQIRYEMEQLKKEIRTKEVRMEGVVNENAYLRKKVYDMSTMYNTGIQPSLSQGRLEEVTRQMGQLQTMMYELMLRDRGIPGTMPHPTTQQHSHGFGHHPGMAQYSDTGSTLSSVPTVTDDASMTSSVSTQYTGVNNYPDAPYDPNLKCTVCGKTFRCNEVQKCKRHNDKCQEKERQRALRTAPQ